MRTREYRFVSNQKLCTDRSSSGEVDEETKEWELEQLRRGGRPDMEQKNAPTKPVYKAVPSQYSFLPLIFCF